MVVDGLETEHLDWYKSSGASRACFRNLGWDITVSVGGGEQTRVVSRSPLFVCCPWGN